MVDAVVSFAVKRLGDFLIQQVDFLRGVRDEVEWMKTELKWMQSFLKDAEGKIDGDERVRMWISDIRDIAYDIEDVIDTFILKVKVDGTSTPKWGFLASLNKCSCICNKEIDLYNIGKDIEVLRKRVVEISRRREAYGIKNIGDVGEGTSGAVGKLRQLRRTSSYADEEEAVGFEDVASTLVDELFKDEQRRCVISIFGMGGLGKTTLARKLYHHSRVKRTFEHRAWVCVSQEYRIRDLLRRIIITFKQVNKEELEALEKMTEEELERHLRDLLQKHRYLMVIDDVWEEEAWKSLRRAFPENRNGSRVIVTTRIKAVAERFDEGTYLHQLRFLRSDESWELFCKKAFPYHDATGGDTFGCPSDLETLGRAMVTKCGGLPLAIIVLGGLLSRKQPREWQTVKEHIWRHLRNESNTLSQILALSFNDLPYQLKPCFLYLGLFPEDHELDVTKLIRMWVAEGFIALQDQETLEEAAEDWLNELIGRSLIQAVSRNWQKIVTCRVHDLLRDLAINKAKDLNFLRIYDENINPTSASSSTSSYRRQAAYSCIERYVSVEYSNPLLRSLLFFDPNPDRPSAIRGLTLIGTRFKLLRVLELEKVQFYKIERRISLPNEIGDLIHLRYLGLKNTNINEFPASIFNLQALQTLDTSRMINYGSLEPTAWTHKTVRFSSDVGKLKQLRHLIGHYEGLLGIDHLTNLQTLVSVYIRSWININTVNLINLRELEINDHGGGSVEEFSLKCISNLKNLQSFHVHFYSIKRISSFEPLSHCRHLLQLGIHGHIDINLPQQLHEYLPNLKYLHFGNCQLRQDPMPILEKLPNLLILVLDHFTCIDSRKWICTAKGFPHLEVLSLRSGGLMELEVKEGAMSKLKVLDLIKCENLIVPEKLKSALNKHLDYKYLSLRNFFRM